MKNLLFIALILCSKFVFASPDSAKVYYEKGMEEKEARRFLVSHQNFVKAINFKPDFTEAYLQDGYVALEMRKTDLAMQQFNKVLQYEPSNAAAIKELTTLYLSYRQFAKAIEFAKKCSSCEFTNRTIGLSYYQQEDYTQAIKYLTAALAQNPKDAEATYTLGRTYLDNEDYKKAVPFYLKAIEMSPEKSTWSYELGLLYYNNSDYKNAVKMFDLAQANGYRVANDFKENMGFALLYAGETTRGEEMIADLLKRKSGNTDLQRSLAEIFYQQKQYDKSLEYCQQLMQVDGNDAKALYQAGLCFIKKDQKEKGQQMCDKAIILDPSLASKRTKKEMPGF